ncbi:cytochrome c biogenesis protein DipZ [Candidatus Gracilibacteria bacterium]|nr:cytochrome c biogenesis protein DipZ [Candidatus Gracilibacteria bacterium]
MNYLLLSFFAGLLTVLAPCALPVLPVILGGSLTGRSWLRPLVITLSLGLSIVIFTLLLKVSTLFLDIPQSFWQWFSGGIILFFGLMTLFPGLWGRISNPFENRSQKLLSESGRKQGIVGMILIGASLGPVFASCSPVYFVILATVLPVSFFTGLANLIAYGLGIALILFLISIFGQRLISKCKWAANPRGIFRKILGIVFIIVGISIWTGWEKDAEIWLLDNGLFDVTKIEQKLLRSADSESVTISNAPMNTSFPFKLYYQAPELEGLENWINSEPINSLEALRGKVVLVDFWTYSCINCIRTLPYLKSWHEKYADDGLVILGIHAPEFAFEKKFENVQKAVLNFGLSYPVVQDNDFRTWRNYENHYWPAKYLIDRDGFVRYTHFGEGKYDETEKAITALLGTQIQESKVSAQDVNFRQIGTPETYIGTKRRENMVEGDTALRPSQWKLVGDWNSEAERAVSESFPSSIKMKFYASKANLVMGGNAEAEVYIDGEKTKTLQINAEQLYEVANFGGQYGEHEIEIRFTSGERIELYAWTFG